MKQNETNFSPIIANKNIVTYVRLNAVIKSITKIFARPLSKNSNIWKHLETFGNIWKHLETF